MIKKKPITGPIAHRGFSALRCFLKRLSRFDQLVEVIVIYFSGQSESDNNNDYFNLEIRNWNVCDVITLSG